MFSDSLSLNSGKQSTENFISIGTSVQLPSSRQRKMVSPMWAHSTGMACPMLLTTRLISHSGSIELLKLSTFTVTVAVACRKNPNMGKLRAWKNSESAMTSLPKLGTKHFEAFLTGFEAMFPEISSMCFSCNNSY